MSKIFKISFLMAILFLQFAQAREEHYTKNSDKIFTSALSIINNSKYTLKEINYLRGKALFTTQTDAYYLELMQNDKECILKIEEVNSPNENTKSTIDKIFLELNAQHGTK